ncbi:glycosyltransferase family 2 protein [Microbacterium sp.]|uniref:glycosyltransferase family 2 protein n=1 Tax=Microbacterium sp. TaxID=51671 RepID=UPI0039E30BDD
MFSVVIPAYNSESTIEAAVRSAVSSGASEVIVVDDGSTDATAEVSIALGAVIIRQENSGASAARRVGAEAATGEYLVFLDADDELVPNGVRESVTQLVREPSLAVCAGTIIGVGSHREVAFPIRYSPVTTETLLREGYGPWPPAAAVLRRAAYEATLQMAPPPLSPRYAEDYELLIRLSIVGGIKVHETPAAKYRLVGGKSARAADSAIMSKENIRAYYADFCGLSIDLMSHNDVARAALVRTARAQWSSGSRVRAAITLGQWMLRNPTASFKTLASRPWNRN